MTVSRASKIFKKTIYRIYWGIETPYDFFVKCTINIKTFFSNEDPWRIYNMHLQNKLKSMFLKNKVFNFYGIRFPDFSENQTYFDSFIWSYFDIIFLYRKGDKYSPKILDTYDWLMESEGPYCYEDNNINVSVNENDVVIDAGAWIGPFSAYAAKKKATVYAFEPSAENRIFLLETARLNGSIEVIPMGLSDESSVARFVEDGMGSKILDKATDGDNHVEITTLDEFVLKNNLKKIDFIKSDIEGFERKMLKGATNVLRTHAPKLAICTYHFPDDPQILSSIILEANPKYKIVQRRMKLYAQVI